MENMTKDEKRKIEREMKK